MIKISRYSSSSRTSNLNFPRLRLRPLTILLSNPPPPHQPSRQQLLNHTRIHTSAKIHIPRRRRRRKKKTMMIFWKRSKRRRHTYTPSSSSSSNTLIPSSSSCSSRSGFSILGLNRRWNRFFLSSFLLLKRSFFEGLLLLLLLLFPCAAVRGTALVDRQLLSCGWSCCRNFLLHGSSFDDYWW